MIDNDPGPLKGNAHKPSSERRADAVRTTHTDVAMAKLRRKFRVTSTGALRTKFRKASLYGADPYKYNDPFQLRRYKNLYNLYKNDNDYESMKRLYELREEFDTLKKTTKFTP